jgi:response regulator RpfG family c-di-GMP phosphodiesterase
MSEAFHSKSDPSDPVPDDAQIAEFRVQIARNEEELKIRADALCVAAAEVKRLSDLLNASFDPYIKFCYQTLNTFDPLLGDQARAVVDISSKMAKSDYFTEQERTTFLTAAWLHDLGLINFHRSVLHKMYSTPAALTEDEQKALRQHPIRGQQLAYFADNMRSVGETIRAHHERFDGHGYPDGFAGEMIPWTARCLAIAIFFVECGLSKQQALDAILKQSGTAFDPEAVRLFFKMTQADSLPHQIREVMVDELMPGMCLTEGIYNNAGLLLFPEGQALTEATITKIKNHNLLSSVRQRLLVFG